MYSPGNSLLLTLQMQSLWSDACTESFVLVSFCCGVLTMPEKVQILWSLRVFLTASDVTVLYGLPIEFNHSTFSFFAFVRVVLGTMGCRYLEARCSVDDNWHWWHALIYAYFLVAAIFLAVSQPILRSLPPPSVHYSETKIIRHREFTHVVVLCSQIQQERISMTALGDTDFTYSNDLEMGNRLRCDGKPRTDCHAHKRLLAFRCLT